MELEDKDKVQYTEEMRVYAAANPDLEHEKQNKTKPKARLVAVRCASHQWAQCPRTRSRGFNWWWT